MVRIPAFRCRLGNDRPRIAHTLGGEQGRDATIMLDQVLPDRCRLALREALVVGRGAQPIAVTDDQNLSVAVELEQLPDLAERVAGV
jgi:hypothetical protein